MDVRIFRSEDSSAYSSFISDRNLELDVYFDFDFLNVDAKLQNGSLEIFCVTDGPNFFLYPYVRLDFPTEHPVMGKFAGQYDITSPYGYCGPISNDENLFKRAEQVFIAYAAETSIVSEFVRYHYDSPYHFENDIVNIHNRNIVLLDLALGEDTIWTNEFSGSNRNLIRRMQKEGYEFKTKRDARSIDEFVSLYFDTMRHANATNFYFFSRGYFHELFNKLGDKIELGMVQLRDVTYCAALCLKFNDYLTYFLSGRKIDSGTVPATNFAIYNFMKIGISEGRKKFNLGGGHSISAQDSLFKFKSNFSKRTSLFYIGKRIFNKLVYKDLCENFIDKNGLEAFNKVNGLLHFYRS